MRAGLNQYPPMAGVPALREAHRRQDRGALRPPLRPGDRDHRHRRRDAGDHHRHPRRRAPGRRGDRARARATTATCRTSSWPAAARCTCRSTPRHASGPTSTGSPRRSRRARARSSSTRRTTRARTVWTRGRHARARRAAARRPTCCRDQRRGLRAHGLRRRAPPERGPLPGTGGAQLRRLAASARPTT